MPALIDFRKGVGESGANAPVQHDDHTHARKEELEWANMSHIEICRAAKDNGPGSKVPSRSTYVTGPVPNGPNHAITTTMTTATKTATTTTTTTTRIRHQTQPRGK